MNVEEKQPMVTIEKIEEITAHENADRLEIARVLGWNIVVQKDVYKSGELIAYFRIDSVLPQGLEEKLFPSGSKIKLEKSRIRSIKIRGAYSHGMIVPLNDLNLFDAKLGEDITGILGVGKFEPIVKKGNKMYTGGDQKGRKKKAHDNPNFNKVRKPENLKNYHGVMEGKDVVITEKIHGTSFVAGWVKRPTNTWKERLTARFFDEYEFCFRSMNVQLQRREGFWGNLRVALGLYNRYTPYYGNNVYADTCRQYNLKDIIPKGLEITGEIYGDGIQKNYTYGCVQDETKLAVFGIRCNGENVSPEVAIQIVDQIGLDYVPILFKGECTQEIIDACTIGQSVLNGKQKVREGCVIETRDGSDLWFGKPLVKSINPKYLDDKNNTDFH